MAATSVLLLLTCNVYASFGHALVNPADDQEQWSAGSSRTSAEEPPGEGQLALNTQPNEDPDELLNQLHLVLSSISQNNETPTEETAGDLASAISAMTAAVVASSSRVDQQIMQLRKDNAAQIESAIMAVHNQVASLEESVADLQQLVDKQRQLAAEEEELSATHEDLFAISTVQPEDITDGSITITPSTITLPTHATLERTRKIKKKLELIGGMSNVNISVTDIVLPAQVFVGDSALLECLWTGYPIYSLRWYKDDENIFTIIPGADDKRAYDGVPGVFVDIESSDMEILVLRDVNEATSGLYKCEVVGEGPQFQTIDVQQELQVQAASTPSLSHITPITVYSTPVPHTTVSLSENAADTPWCEEPGFIIGDSCFKMFSSVRKSWQAARKYCQDQGADLAMPNQMRWFSKHLRERPNKEGKGRFWLGASHAENGWQWNSNKNLKQAKIRFPATSFKGECLFIAPYAKTVLKSRACKSVEAFICQSVQPQVVLVPTTRPPAVLSTIAALESSDSDESTSMDTITTDSPELEIDINTTIQPSLTDDSLEPLVNKTDSVHIASKTAADNPLRPIFTECKSPYFQVGEECFMVHLKPSARHEAEDVCSSTNGSFLADPSNISLLRDYIYKLQDLDYQIDYWLGSWSWVPSNISIPGKNLLPQNHNWCVVFTPKQCPYLAIDHCHSKKPVICQVIIESNDVIAGIPLVECPPSTFQLGSQCFQYHIEDESWYAARQTCQAQGGDLAQPHDLNNLRKELIHQHANWDFWLGGSDIEAEGKWTWLSGGDITGPWRRKQPGGGKKENCLDFRKGNQAQINDYKCERKQKFICEFDPVPKVEEVQRDSPDCSHWCRPPNFMLGNECFALVQHDRKWEEAQRYCKDEGGSLAQPQNLEVLSDYLAINLANGAIEGSGRYWLGGYWLHTSKPMGKIWGDIQDIAENDDCMTIDINKENVISSKMCNTSQPFICQAYPEFWQKVGTQEMLVTDLKKVTWSEAQELCQGSDGRLANIYQHDEFVSFMHSQHRFKSFWVGASYSNPEGQWQWSSGVSLDPDFPWNISQPQTDDDIECMQLSYYALDKKPKFVSRNCGENAYFVCDSNTPETNIDMSIEEDTNIDDESDDQGEKYNESNNLEENLIIENVTPNQISTDDDTHVATAVTDSPQDNEGVTGYTEEDITNVTESDDDEVSVIIYEIIKEDITYVTESDDDVVKVTNHKDIEEENNIAKVTGNSEEDVINVTESDDDGIDVIDHEENKEENVNENIVDAIEINESENIQIVFPHEMEEEDGE